MKNPYKRTDVFACNYQGHAQFSNRVSVFHVLRQKNCYPQGCLMFKWSCELKNKGKSCYRGFNYIGRLCEGCTHFLDEKIHYQPRILISAAEFEAFQEELEEFDEWIAEFQNRDVDLLGTISSVKPRFKKTIANGKGQLRLDGYLLVLSHGYIDTTEFADYFYAKISPQQQDRLRFAAGDTFEARGRMNLDHARVLFNKMWAVNYIQRSGKPTWNNSRALVARAAATEFQAQPESCIKCPYGALIDTIEYVDGQKQFKRSLYCLEGIVDPQVCYISTADKVDLCSIRM
ncbi:hypothetical protein JW998_09130 [candidate division KSB1 bacterium]|nr:hypothetical protein [candidate division KSB1 bacterium]